MRKPWKTWNVFQISIAMGFAITLNWLLSTAGSNEQLPGFVRMGAYLLIPVVIGAGFYVLFSRAKGIDERNDEPASAIPSDLCARPKQIRIALLAIGIVLEGWLLYLLIQDALRGSWVTCVLYGVTMVIAAVGVAAARKFRPR